MGCRSVVTVYLFFMFFPLLLNNSEAHDFNVNVTKLSVDERAEYILDSNTEYIVEILNLSNSIERIPPRINIRCENCHQDHPLLVVIRQNKGVLSWELPVVIKSDYENVYKETEQTLCPYDILNNTSPSSHKNWKEIEADTNITHPVTISLSTSSYDKKVVELLVTLEEKFVLDLNAEIEVKLTPSSPSFFLYVFPPENVTSVLLQITSEEETCMVVSIQNVSCPVFDLEENIQYKGHFQTVTRQGALTVTKESFPNGFYVVLIVSGEDRYCSSVLLNSSKGRSKNIKLSVSKTISSDDYKFAVGITFFIVTAFCVIMFMIYYIKFNREKNLIPNIDDECLFDQEVQPSTSVHSQLPSNNTNPTSPAPYTPGTDSLSIKTDSSLDETDLDLLPDAELDKNIFRMKTCLSVSDLARKSHTFLKKKSELYFWNLMTVAIFYFLPVIHVVITNQYQLNQTGKEDLCFYNFLCSHPLWVLSDFNHVFSNIGYLFLGALFILLTVFKERVYKLKISRNKNLYRNYGIPQHFGLFYAMGAALIIEGIMSSCYHVCPNHYNFQYDSSFMYVICTLCMIKIYQTRHPDINASAHTTFFLLAGVIIIGMLGILNNGLVFWILFTIFHLSTCLYLSLQVYYMGRWRLRLCIFVRFFRELQLCGNCYWRFFFPMFPSRFVLLIMANGCNWGLAIASFFFDIKNFPSYLLTIFMVNLLLYTAFYILMKFICHERLLLQSVVHMILATVAWCFALYFFFKKTTSSMLTPADSKVRNQNCQLLDFYDNHDIWHFISATAMFFSFMVLLNLDDDLIYVHRSKIAVF